eukprot:RCo039698
MQSRSSTPPPPSSESLVSPLPRSSSARVPRPILPGHGEPSDEVRLEGVELRPPENSGAPLDDARRSSSQKGDLRVEITDGHVAQDSTTHNVLNSLVESFTAIT